MLVITLVMFAASASYWAVSLVILLRGIRAILITNGGFDIGERFTMADVDVSKLYIAEVYLPMVNVCPHSALRYNFLSLTAFTLTVCIGRCISCVACVGAVAKSEPMDVVLPAFALFGG